MNSEQFLAALSKNGAPYALNPPLGDAELSAWRSASPTAVLPIALEGFLRFANGFRFATDADAQGYFALLPLRDYRAVRHALFGESVDTQPEHSYLREEWPDHRLAISSHLDGTQLIALDTHTGDFLDADAYDKPRVISASFHDLLAWLKEHWLDVLKPR